MVCRTRSAKALLLGASTIALMANVTATRAQNVSLDPITVLATKTAEKAIDALAGVSTVRQEQINEIMPTRTTDLFYGLPSVWFQTRGDQPETSINIRGVQDFGRVAVLIDGARQNFQRSGHNANGTFVLEPELLAGLDIVRGPVANIYGSGAIGGVASFRTKDADDILRPGERFATLGHVMGATNQAQGLGSIFAAARPNANVDLFAGGTIRSMANYVDGNGDEVANTANKVATAIGKFTVRPAEGHEFKLGAINYDAWYQTGQRFPIRSRSTTPTSSTTSSPHAGAMPGPTIACSISTATSTGPRRSRTRERLPTGRPVAWAIRSPASSEIRDRSASTPRASTSATHHASTSGRSGTP